MKKLIRLFAAALSISAAATVAAQAAGERAGCAVSNGIAQNSYSVSVAVSTANSCDGYQAKLKYDTEKYTLLTADGANIKRTSDGVNLAFVEKDGKSADWTVLKFESKQPASKNDFVFEDAKTVVHNGSTLSEITSNVFLSGDANNDDSIDIIDLVRLKKVVGKVSGVETQPGADCNGDGEYTADDLAILRKYILGVPGASFGRQ